MGEFTLLTSELGAGGYGKVVQAKHNATGKLVAAKLISTGRMKLAAIQKEVRLMQQLIHPNIIGIEGTEEQGKTYIIYMELATNGELFSRVINAGSLTEADARRYFMELVDAVKYMHEHNVVHRDLKLVRGQEPPSCSAQSHARHAAPPHDSTPEKPPLAAVLFSSAGECIAGRRQPLQGVRLWARAPVR